MKKAFCLLLAVAFIMSVVGCTSNSFNVEVGTQNEENNLETYTDFSNTDPSLTKQLSKIIRYDKYSDASGYSYDLSYNNDNQLIGLMQGQASSEDKHTPTFTYSSEGKLLWIITGEPTSAYAPGHNSGCGYEYDSSGQLIKEFAWEGGYGETKYYYDSRGRCTRSVETTDFSTQTENHVYGADGVRLYSEVDVMYSDGGTGLQFIVKYDYSYGPFVLKYREDTGWKVLALHIDDDISVLNFLFMDEVQFYVDADGYLEKAETEEETYYFYYNENKEEAVPIPTVDPATIDGTVFFNGHYYKVYNGQSSWEDAAAFCQSVGGHLATITSEGENTFLYDYLVSLGLSGAYFGLSDVNIECEWVWCTGEEVMFTNWDSGEPNNEGQNEHYGLFDFSHNDGKWNDGSYRSGTNTNFICEWDTVIPPDTGNNGGTKTVYLLKQAVTYNIDYDNQPSKTKTFQYNQDGQLNGVTIEIVSKRTQNGETSYKKQLLEYNLECDESGCYTGFSASLDGSYSGKGTITCDTNSRIVEFYSSEAGQTYSFSYNADSLICGYIYEYNGEIYTQSTMQYDSRGNVVATERIQRDGSRSELRTEIEYDVGDGLVMMTQYIDGVEQNSILQRCDTYGNVMKEEYYKDGALTGWIEYTYDVQTVPDSWQKLPDLILALLGG